MVDDICGVLCVLHVDGDLHARVHNTQIQHIPHDLHHILRAPGNRLCGDHHPVFLSRTSRPKVLGSECVLEAAGRRPTVTGRPRRSGGRGNRSVDRMRETVARRRLVPAEVVQPGVRACPNSTLQLYRFRHDISFVHNAVLPEIEIRHSAEHSAGLSEYTVHGYCGRIDHVGKRTSMSYLTVHSIRPPPNTMA